MSEPKKPCPGCGKYRIADEANLCYNCANGITHVPLGVTLGAKPIWVCGGCGDKHKFQHEADACCRAPFGTKADKGKPRWSLLPIGVMRDIIAVLEHGAVKYSVGNWQHVDEPGRRYYDAAMRHIDARADGEKNDPDSGLPHLAHAIASLMFLMWFEAKGKC